MLQEKLNFCEKLDETETQRPKLSMGLSASPHWRAKYIWVIPK
jgi:hypothetical protein